MVPTNDDDLNQDSLQDLQPLDPRIIPQNSDDGLKDPVNVFFENFPVMMSNALMMVLQQDAKNLKLLINRAQSLFSAAKKVSTDRIEIILMQYMTKYIEIFQHVERGMKFQVEGRLQTAQNEYKTASEFCYSQAKELKETVGSAEPDKMEVIEYWTLLYGLFGGWMGGYTKYCEAEIIGYEGRTRQYVAMLRETVGSLREAVDILPPGSPDDLVQVGFLCSNLADQLEARAEAFEKQSVTKRYVEPSGEKVFIIHGHDEARWRELRDLLEDEFNLEVIVLKEEPGSSRTIIEKFEDYAMVSFFAFAILTPDDFILKGKIKYLQARPNVLFEMGWFFGRYGASHLCILKNAGTELPSDLGGISTIDFRENITEQSLAIRNELRQVGLLQ